MAPGELDCPQCAIKTGNNLAAAPSKATKPKRSRKGTDPDEGTGGVLARVG